MGEERKRLGVIIEITKEEAEDLLDALIDATDCGSSFGPYKSDERQALTDKIYNEIERQLGE